MNRKYNTEEERKAAARERAKKWALEHKERRKEICANYIAKHKEERSESVTKYNYTHKDEINTKSRERYNNHIEEERERSKNYRKTKIGRASSLCSSYKAADRLKGRENNVTKEWIVDNIFTSKCSYCGDTDWTHLGCDRVDNSIGHTIDNVVCSCERCNLDRQYKKLSYNDYRKVWEDDA